MYKIIATIFTIILLSSITSATYYIEASSEDNTREDSSYIHPNYLPKQDIFYTPFNAYRTYCSASYCPQSVKIVQVQRPVVQVPQLQLVVVEHNSYPYYHNQPIRVRQHPRPMPPIFLH